MATAEILECLLQDKGAPKKSVRGWIVTLKASQPRLEEYSDVVPNLVFEVRSPTDCWVDTWTTIAEHLNAGVTVVCVLDPKTKTVTICDNQGPPKVLDKSKLLRLPGFQLPVARLFE